MPATSYRECLRAAHREALQRDPRVFVMGEDVGLYGGTYAVTKGLLAEFGEDRVRDAPLSELGFVGAGIGAAMAGMRPIVEVMTVNFSLLALDQIVNNAATLRHMSGGQVSVPLVIRMATGAGRQLAAQHSHSLEVWYAHVPGIKVLAPATLEDARGMLWPALEDPDPVVIFEHAQLYNLEGELPDPLPAVDLRRAAVRRPGRDLSVVTYGGSLPRALEAARQLDGEGISAEVIDPRTMVPLDSDAILNSVGKTGRLVIVDPAHTTCSAAAEISAIVVEKAFDSLKAPIMRVTTPDTQIPFSPALEKQLYPSRVGIAAAVRRVVGARPAALSGAGA